MTSADVATILLRRWYFVVIGLALTAAAMWAVNARPGVYATQVDVLFLAPKSARYPNPIEVSSESLTATAGLVARMVEGDTAPPAAASSTVTLTGEGIRQGYSIRLPNSGGQWVASFDRPVLDVQAAGPSEGWVRRTVTDKIDLIGRTLYSLQKADGTARPDYIFTSVNPASPTVVYATGQPKRAVAATLLLGSILTCLGTVGFDRLLRRLRTRSTAPGLQTLRTETA